ncbi:ABC transporter ATP-binding protein [Intrasporangium sp. DVR]|uniref:ABC transporter ATP-binding protein n=1 Tax=Intrasporangium sp. DVR TaxID=3127867 RepID=UPI00313A60ED
MPVLEAHGVTYSYDGYVTVLEEVGFTVDAGEIVGLLGPNGSGKSTLIKTVFDLLRLQAGSITVSGHEHASPAAKSAAIYLASNDYLPQFLTGREYIEMLGRLYGVDVDHAAAARLFETFSMSGRFGDLIEDYSHGMRKKTQIVSALLLRRPLTIIDETLNGIDIEALHLTGKELGRLRDEGRSVVLCTHDFALLERLADRVLFLDHGVLVADASTASLVDEHGSLAAMVFGRLDAEHNRP